MQSLSLKGFVDLRLTGPVRSGLADSEVSLRRQWVNCRNPKRTSGFTTCAIERNGNGGGESWSVSSSPILPPSSLLSRTHTYALLKQQMEVAAKSEVSVLV